LRVTVESFTNSPIRPFANFFVVTGSTANGQQFFDTLATFGRPLAIKLYRLKLERPPTVPLLPCLDHEAMLHGDVDPHAAVYLQDVDGDLHELVYVPDARRIDVDVVSTIGENRPASHDRLVAALRERCPGFDVRVIGPSWIRGDRRVARACRAQVTLRDILVGPDIDRIKAAVDRLGTISLLMEKESRVASWGARTVMTPLIAVAGFLSFETLATFAPSLGSYWVATLRYATVTVVGAFFLYYGLRAVHLTGMANRVWKRSAEYGLILKERQRLTSNQAIKN
jgi:hypothetical protein